MVRTLFPVRSAITVALCGSGMLSESHNSLARCFSAGGLRFPFPVGRTLKFRSPSYLRASSFRVEVVAVEHSINRAGCHPQGFGNLIGVPGDASEHERGSLDLFQFLCSRYHDKSFPG